MTSARLAPRSALAALTALSLASMLACGGRGGDADGARASAGASGGAAGRKSLTIAMIAKSSTNPLFLSGRAGADSAARELSRANGVDVKIDWLTPPNEDAAVQAQRVTQAVNAGDDAILISASEAAKVAGAIDEAVARGVPVMTFDSDVPTSRRFSFYGGDDEAMGHQVVAELAKLLGDKGKIAMLGGNQNAPNLQKRVKGARDEAAKHPGIQVVNVFYHNETPQDAAAEVLRVQNAYPDVQGWAMLGGWALLTRSLLTDLDPNRVKIVSIDALPAELPYVDRGLAPVLLAQPTFDWGYVSVKTIFDKVYLKKDVPPHVQMELIRVSKENLGDWARKLEAWGFTDVDPKFVAQGR